MINMPHPVHRILRRSIVIKIDLKAAQLFTILILLSCFFLFTSTGYAYYNHPKEYELSLLPRYLEVKVRSFLGLKTPDVVRDAKKYGKKLGPAYGPLHHYGLGLIYLSRVHTRGMNYPNYKFDLDSALKEFNFVIKYSIKDSFILYKVYYNRGEVYMLQNKIAKAVQNFWKSIKLKPDYFNSYLMLSECYKRLDNNEKAEKILEIGRTRIGKKKKKK